MKAIVVALYNYQGRGLDSWHDHGAGATYMAAKTADCNVSFLDMKGLRSDAELTNKLRGYDLISFGLKSSYYPIGMKVIKIAKSLGSKVMVGGYHASAAPRELEENPNIDYILRGESDITFPKFLKDPSKFGRTIIGSRPENLDLLPWIDRSIYTNQLEDCGGWWHGHGFSRMISVMAARGCPFQCAFCQPIEDIHFGKGLRRRSVDNLISELKWLKDLYHPQCVMIHDDTFFIQNNWLEEFAEKYPQVNLPFWAAARSDGICHNPELLRKLVKVGWNLVSVGFESGSDRILKKIKKGVTAAQNIESARIIKEAGAKIYANYILGFPWETKEDIQLTMKMADTIKAEMPSWAFFTPYPGCELGEECINNGWSLLDRNHYDRCPYGQKVKYVDYSYVNKALKGFREEVPRFLCDIIIPCYENEDVTLKCLKSIREFTHEAIYRVILVDNNSKNYSRVETFLKAIPSIYLKLHKNEGFVGAVNEGLKISTAPYICLLNNDTEVTNNWLTKLIHHLERKPDLGIVGPVTGFHKIGADSHHSLELHKRLVPPESKKDGWTIDRLNEHLERTHPDCTAPIAFVAFFCAVIKREVFDKVGYLDPNFKMGLWDDNDYNLSTRALGYKTELAIDTCIYHRGRTTFNLVEKKEGFDVDALLKTNKAYLDKKHNLQPPPERVQNV